MSAPKRFVRLNADAQLEETFRELLGKGAKFKVLDAEGSCSEYYDYLKRLYNDGALNIKDFICSIYDTSDYEDFVFHFNKNEYTKAEMFDNFASFCTENLAETISAVVIETDMEIYIILIEEYDEVGEFHNILSELVLAISKPQHKGIVPPYNKAQEEILSKSYKKNNDGTVEIDLGQVFAPHQDDNDIPIPKMNIPLCDIDNTVQIITKPMFAEL